MKAYKATYDFKCKNLTFEIGKTYTHEGKLILCQQGFHFCKNPDDLFDYYPYKPNLKILEIEVLRDVIDEGNKSVTNKLKVLREILFSEWNNIFTKYQFVKRNNELEIKREYSSGYWTKTIYDEKGNKIKYDDLDGYWQKYSYDDKDNQIYFEDSNNRWYIYSYDKKGNMIKKEDSNGNWEKFNYDDNGNKISIEYSVSIKSNMKKIII